jgi:hypothetical protein
MIEHNHKKRTVVSPTQGNKNLEGLTGKINKLKYLHISEKILLSLRGTSRCDLHAAK